MVRVGWLKLSLIILLKLMSCLTLPHMKKLPVSFFVYLFLTLTWFIVIQYLLLYYQPDGSTYSKFRHFDKLIHFFLFFVQSFTLSQTIYLYRGYFSFKIYVFIIIILLSFGIITEVQQQYISFRTFDYYDLITNIIGVVTGVFCVKFFNK